MDAKFVPVLCLMTLKNRAFIQFYKVEMVKNLVLNWRGIPIFLHYVIDFCNAFLFLKEKYRNITFDNQNKSIILFFRVSNYSIQNIMFLYIYIPSMVIYSRPKWNYFQVHVMPKMPKIWGWKWSPQAQNSSVLTRIIVVYAHFELVPCRGQNTQTKATRRKTQERYSNAVAVYACAELS